MINLKSRNTKIILLVLVLILVTGGYAGILEYNKSKEESQTTETISVLSIDSTDISKMSYSVNGETLAFSLTDSAWVYDGDPDFPLEGTYLDNIVSTASTLTAVRELADNLDNNADYGLDTPTYTLTLTDSEGNTVNMYIGDQNSVSGNYYAYTSLGDTIYMIDSTLVSYLGYGLYDMMV